MRGRARGHTKLEIASPHFSQSSIPPTQIILRGDGGFCRDAIMTWCETHQVDFILGLPKNARLKEQITEEMALAQKIYKATGKAARVFKDFSYQTLNS